MKNRMIAWVSGVVLVVVTLMVIIVKLEPPRDGIIRAQAMKAMALALTDKEECEKRAKERGTSHFFRKRKGQLVCQIHGFISTTRAIWTRSLRRLPWPQPRDILHTRRLHTWPARCPAS